MADEFDAFTEGVELGGLRNKNQIKLLLEYLVDFVNEPLTGDILVDALTTGDIANYFEVTGAIDELNANAVFEINENGFVSLTQKGLVTLRELMDELPLSVREEATQSVNLAIKKLRNKENNSAEIIENENGFTTVCKVLQGETVIMKLEIYSLDFESAQTVKQSFLADPAKIYSAVCAAF